MRHVILVAFLATALSISPTEADGTIPVGKDAKTHRQYTSSRNDHFLRDLQLYEEATGVDSERVVTTFVRQATLYKLVSQNSNFERSVYLEQFQARLELYQSETPYHTKP